MVAWDHVTRADVLRAINKSTTDWGRSGSSLNMVSPLPRLMSGPGKDAVTRRKQSWAQLMSSPRASDLAPVTSRAGRQAP
jgi:hypothetical protein